MVFFFFFQAEDGIRDLVRSRGLGDVYKRQILMGAGHSIAVQNFNENISILIMTGLYYLMIKMAVSYTHLTLPTSDLV